MTNIDRNSGQRYDKRKSVESHDKYRKKNCIEI